METKELLKEIKVGPHSIRLSLHGQVPVAEHDHQTYKFLWGLVEKIPQLSDCDYIQQFAYLSNFFWKAGQFQYIDSVGDYQKFYLERVEYEKSHSADLFAYRLTDFKIFDVSVMHAPKVEDKLLIYFTYNTANGLPYRVVCAFPYHLESTFVHYQILPIQEN